MEKAFSAKFADFGKISGKKNALGFMWISQIVHKAFIEINEKGGEAAAATGVEVSVRSISKPEFFRADRPFMFLIADTETETLLFLGRLKTF